MDRSWDVGGPHTILGHCDLDFGPTFENNRVLSISPILFEEGIKNLVYVCIFGW